ncbi:MAG: hypothetical protein Q3980_10325 [Turicibacter sp.]|nr:hypothetical protein [Turicibacter sp.]
MTSNKKFTHYFVHEKRGSQALNPMEFFHLSKEQSSMIIGHRILNMMIAPMLYVMFII